MKSLVRVVNTLWNAFTEAPAPARRAAATLSQGFDRVFSALRLCGYQNLVFDSEAGELILEIDYSFGLPSPEHLTAARQALARDVAQFLEESKLGKFYSGRGLDANESIVYGQANGPRARLTTRPSGALRLCFENVRSDLMCFLLPRYARRFGPITTCARYSSLRLVSLRRAA